MSDAAQTKKTQAFEENKKVLADLQILNSQLQQRQAIQNTNDEIMERNLARQRQEGTGG